MGTIYLTAFPQTNRGGDGDVLGAALAEDGEMLGGHISSNIQFAKHDMGLTSEWKHDAYKAHYPEGYELTWIDDPRTDPRWQEALRLNHERYPLAQAERVS